MTKQGRPAGLLINPAAARLVLDRRPQAWLAVEAGVSTAHLSAMLAGVKGATPDLAERIATALNVDPSVVFPELADLPVRIFTATKRAAA